jgi:hypothetical protein
MLNFLIKYIALWFLLAALVLVFTWWIPARGADGSKYIVLILVGIGLLIMYKSYRNTGKLFTDEAGGH